MVGGLAGRLQFLVLEELLVVIVIATSRLLLLIAK